MRDRGSLERIARQMAQARGIDPDLFVRLIDQESGFDPTARSEKGALGLAQIMPDTAKDPGYGVQPIMDRLDPMENLRFGADYFAAMMKKFGGDTEKALAAYNFGVGNVSRGKSYPAETKGYINAIMQRAADSATTPTGEKAGLSGLLDKVKGAMDDDDKSDGIMKAFAAMSAMDNVPEAPKVTMPRVQRSRTRRDPMDRFKL